MIGTGQCTIKSMYNFQCTIFNVKRSLSRSYDFHPAVVWRCRLQHIKKSALTIVFFSVQFAALVPTVFYFLL
jgi:hypothetical protein